MCKYNQMILIQPPMFLGEDNRRESIILKSHLCPVCSGNGYEWIENASRKRVKKKCKVCRGTGKLDAEVTINWVPSK